MNKPISYALIGLLPTFLGPTCLRPIYVSGVSTDSVALQVVGQAYLSDEVIDLTDNIVRHDSDVVDLLAGDEEIPVDVTFKQMYLDSIHNVRTMLEGRIKNATWGGHSFTFVPPTRDEEVRCLPHSLCCL